MCHIQQWGHVFVSVGWYVYTVSRAAQNIIDEFFMMSDFADSHWLTEIVRL